MPDVSTAVWSPWGRGAGGYAVGIIGVHTDFPLIRGNVVNATTFPFPVYVRVLDEVSGAQIMAYDPVYEGPIIAAGQDLVRLGVRAVVGACGSFANFQKPVAAALPVPTFMSVMLQTTLITQGLAPDQSVGVIAMRASALTDHVFEQCDIHNPDRLHVHSTVDLEQSKKLYSADPTFDDEQFGAELVSLARGILNDRPDTGAWIIQCSELPPYAARIQAATGLPVWDMNSLIIWAHHAVAQRDY